MGNENNSTSPFSKALAISTLEKIYILLDMEEEEESGIDGAPLSACGSVKFCFILFYVFCFFCLH